MAEPAYGSLPFEEAIRFFRGKLRNLPSERFSDVWREQHDTAFMVAGAVKADLLNDLRVSVERAIKDGTTLDQFRREFDQIVARHGWQYRGSRNWRTRVIYETNLRTSYQAGRYAQLTDPDLLEARPFWRYKHNEAVQHPRPLHLSWDGLVLRHDDPWWRAHWPPNGWGCKCRVIAMSERQMRKAGRDGPDRAPDDGTYEWLDKATGEVHTVPRGIDPGWDYAPGASQAEAIRAQLTGKLDTLPPQIGEPYRIDLQHPQSASAPPLSVSTRQDAMPAARSAEPSRILPPDLTEDEYLQAFLAEFGLRATERQTVFEDVTGELLTISAALFTDRRGRLKITKRGREQYVLLLADTIKTPDEIWRGKDDRRRYLARWVMASGEVPALAVFEQSPQGWAGVTALNADDLAYLEEHARAGELIYRREQ